MKRIEAAQQFRNYIGIDYSGRGRPETGVGGLRVFRAEGNRSPVELRSSIPRRSNLSRCEVTEWLLKELCGRVPTLVGLDHAFSIPSARLRACGLGSWASMCKRFLEAVRTHERTVKSARGDRISARLLRKPKGDEYEEHYRLTDRRCSGAKSVFHYVGPGVAHSTMAGISQLALLRREVRKKRCPVHFWPFDGFEVPAGSSLVVEAYPALFNRQFRRIKSENGDQHDARCIALWLREITRDDRLETYLRPPLRRSEQALARREGWILGVM